MVQSSREHEIHVNWFRGCCRFASPAPGRINFPSLVLIFMAIRPEVSAFSRFVWKATTAASVNRVRNRILWGIDPMSNQLSQQQKALAFRVGKRKPQSGQRRFERMNRVVAAGSAERW